MGATFSSGKSAKLRSNQNKVGCATSFGKRYGMSHILNPNNVIRKIVYC